LKIIDIFDFNIDFFYDWLSNHNYISNSVL
ncbi:unnamed protein product, partial [marine sediment metagenome]